MNKPSLSRRTPVFLDDRARPINPAPQFVMAGEIWDRLPVGLWLRTWGVLVLIGVAFFMTSLRKPSPLAWTDLIMWLAMACVWVLWAAWAGRKPPSTQSALATLLAAHRRCGACAYDLHQTTTEADGCVVCPECGSTWHRDRFVFAGRDPRESPELTRLMAVGHTHPDPDHHDDRGTPLLYPVCWPPRWLWDGGTPQTAAEQLEAISRTKRRRFRTRSVPIVLVIWLAAAAVLIVHRDERDAFDAVLVSVVTFLIATIAYVAAERIFMDRVMRRQAVDTLGLCNNCGRTLPTDAPPTFDGCVACASCGRAWRRATPGAMAPAPLSPIA